MTEKRHGPTPGVHLREVSDLKRYQLRERVDCNFLISIFIIDLHRSHYKILKLMNLIFTGCIVPPATTTALASLTMLVKCTAGFNRRNFKLEQLSRPVERYMYNGYDTGMHIFVVVQFILGLNFIFFCYCVW